MERQQENIYRKILLTSGVFIIAVALQTIALNNFLIPNKIFSSGLNGISQLLSLLSEYIGKPVDTGTFLMIFNLPVGLLGWKLLGGKFTILSFANSIAVSLALIVAPIYNLSSNPILATLFGGMLIGVSVGITMRYGFSTGGMDIVAMVIQKLTGKSIGFLMNVMNGTIVLVAGAFIGWENALYTLMGIYVTAQCVDKIHTGYQKVTAMIVTQKGDLVAKELQKDLIRGITIFDTKGAYTGKANHTLMMVLSRYELFEMQEIVHRVDPKAFINIMNTVNIAGEWFDVDNQNAMKKALEQTIPSDDNIYNKKD